MKKVHLTSLLASSAAVMLVAFAASTAYSQQQITHTVTAQNKYCNSTCSLLDIPDLTNNPSAIIIVTPVLVNGVSPNPHPVGVYYAETKKWSVINVDNAAIVEGAKFTVQFFAKPDTNQFVFVVPERQGIACIDRPGLNDKAGADVRFSPTGSPMGAYFNKHVAKLEFDPSVLQWCISNINKEDLRAKTAFNVVVFPDQKAPANTPQVSPSVNTKNLSYTPAQPKQAQGSGPPPPRSPGFPCTNADADQKVGTWGRQQKDSLANADPSFPEAEYRQVLNKAQKAIDLLKAANSQPVGFEPYAYRSIDNYSYTPNGALKFSAKGMYMAYLCNLDMPDDPQRGKIVPGDETGTVIEVTFNSLGRLVNIDQRSLGAATPTPNNEIMFYLPKPGSELRGMSLYSPGGNLPRQDEAVIIVPGSGLPVKPVTREVYLQSLIRSLRSKLKKASASETVSYQAEILRFEEMLGRMSPNERQIQAIIASSYPGRGNIFVSASDPNANRLAVIDKSFFDPQLPRQTIQFITVYWKWNEKDPQESELIRQFKQKFDFEALRQMIGK